MLDKKFLENQATEKLKQSIKIMREACQEAERRIDRYHDDPMKATEEVLHAFTSPRVEKLKMTVEEIETELAALQTKRSAIETDPKSRTTGDTIFLYTKAARKKLDAIDREIARLTGERRKLLGGTVDTSGYSGRQTNRR